MPIRPTDICIVFAAGGLALLSGCATQQQSRFDGPGAQLAQRWAEAANKPIDVEDTVPEEEPELLPMTHFSAGSLLEKQGHFLQAAEQYCKAVELNDEFGAAYARLGLCYIRAGRFEMAVPALKQAADLQPESAQAWNNLGFAHLALKNYDQAKRSLNRALRIRGNFERARMNLAIVLVHQGRDAEALGHLMAVLPEPFAQYNLGTMQLAMDRPDDARQAFQRALNLEARFPAARKGLQEAVARLSAHATDPQTAMASARPAAAQPLQAAEAVAQSTPVARVEPEPEQPIEPRPQRTLEPNPLAATPAPTTRPAGTVARTALASRDEAATPRKRLALDPAATAAWLSPETFHMQPVVCSGLDLASVPVGSHQPSMPDPAAVGKLLRLIDNPFVPVTAGLLTTGPHEQTTAAATVDSVAAPADPAGRHAAERTDRRISPTLRTAILARLTLPASQEPASVVDLDLTSLRWATWMDGMEALQTDVTELEGKALAAVMSDWLRVLNELKTVTTIPYGLTARADDI